MNPWLAGLLGGVLIGLSASLLLLLNGRVAGISGIVNGLTRRPGTADWTWRAAFLAGLMGAGGVAMRMLGQQAASPAPVAVLLLAGVLVGLGTSLGNGCTSGHGVCGLARRSPRSLASVLVFMALGMATATLLRPLLT